MSKNILSNYIHGQFTDTQNDFTFDVINPATGKVIYQVCQASESMIDKAIQSAREGFLRWSSTPPVERSRILQRAANLLRERNDELAAIEVRDTGL